ncbi:hypothetical protein ACFELO_14540 [Oceanicaulis sp. LC35]|uniref:hypothetical protein n=1 Tax=Oceanicaulis sp. LC35 TaxID=3349635 RepID=UPI003F869E56
MVADIQGSAGYLVDLYRTPPRESDPVLINSTGASDAAAIRPVDRSEAAQDRQDRNSAQNRNSGDETPNRSAAAEGFAQVSQDRLNASTNSALLEVQEQRLAVRPEPPQATREAPEASVVARRETEEPAANAPSVAERLSEAQAQEAARQQTRVDAIEAREQRTDQISTLVEDDRQQTDQLRETQRDDAGARQSDRIETRIEDNQARSDAFTREREPELNARPEAPAGEADNPADDGLNAAARAAQEVNPTTAALEEAQSPDETAALRAEPALQVDDAENTDDSGPDAVTRPENGASIGDAETEVTTPNTRFDTRFDRADSGLSTRDNGLSQTDPLPSLVDRLGETAQEPQRVRQVTQPLDNNLDSAVTPQEIAQSGLNLRV